MQLNYVADLLTQQTMAMQNNFEHKDGLDEQALVGGFVFEYSDEWWKAGNPDEHNLGLVKNGQFPLGYLSEEYFGLFSASRAVDPESNTVSETLPNVLRARPTVSLLTKIWGNGTLETEGKMIDNCNSNEDVTTTTNFVAEDALSSPYESFMVLALLGGVFFFMLTVIRTRMRRTKYQPLAPVSSMTLSSPGYQATAESSLLTHDLRDHQVV